MLVPQHGYQARPWKGYSGPHPVSYGLNSLKGAIWRSTIGTTIGVIKGDTRSLDYSSCVFDALQRH